jgi:putative membrane-bound dehydrogenase-like protein
MSLRLSARAPSIHAKDIPMLRSRPLSACLLSLALGLGGSLSAADAKPKFSSDVVRQGLVTIDVDVSGAKQLFLVVGDGGDGFAADWADWVDPVLVGPNGETKLTDLTWTSAKTGWGSAQLHKNVNGGEMKIGGKPVDGIGVHAVSVIAYDIAGKGFTRFKGKAGPDNGGTDQNGGGTTSVQFFVYTEPPPAHVTKPGGATGLAPAESVGALTMAEGLSATLWASEPMFCNPTDIDIDAQGRVWVDEGLNYRQWQHNRPAGDRIVVMDDSTGQGKADRLRVFYQGTDVNAALGMCVLGDKIIVSDSPNVFRFTDNGPDKPPTKELMFTGIAGVQHDHGMHTFVFGPDGKLYFNFGNAGEHIKDKDGKPIIDVDGNEVNNSGHPYRQGMVFRCNPDGSEFEVMGHNFRNNYEVNVDSFGTLWQSDNDDDGNRGTRINYVMEHGNFGYTDEVTGAGWGQGKMAKYPKAAPGSDENWADRIARHWHQYDPGVVPNLLNTGAGSPTGILVYEGDLLPPIFRNQLIHCEPGSNVVRAYILSPDGAGYKAEIVNIMKSKDSWFRPSDVCVAPDGSLFVADWFDPGVGGHQMGDNDPNTAGGRLYRVAPTGSTAVAPKLDLTSAAGAAAALASPNLATRYLAWTKLHELGGQAEGDLVKLWKSSNPRLRARALWLLSKLPEKGAAYISAAAKDADSDIRITALRAASEIKLDIIPLVRDLAKDPSPQVRRECALRLRHSASAEAPGLWTELALGHDGKDRWYLEALGIGADKNEDAFFSAWQAKVGDAWDTPAGRDIVWRSRSNKALPYLVKIIKDAKTPESEQQHYMRAFDFHSGPAKDEALKSLLE